MSKYYVETLRNGGRYIESSRHNYKAKLMNGGGYTSRIDTIDRSYHLTLKIDKEAELSVLQIDPSIHCLEKAREQVGSYITQINTRYKCCNVRCRENGNIYVQCEQRFNDRAITPDLFLIMERECMKILDTFEVVLQKLSNIKLISSEETDVDAMIEKHQKKIKEMLLADLRERALKDIDSLDMDDDELPDDSLLPFIPVDEDYDDVENGKTNSRVAARDFIDLLKERHKNKSEENSEKPNEQKSSNLLSQLLSLDADKTSRPKPGDTLEIPSINASDTMEFDAIEED